MEHSEKVYLVEYIMSFRREQALRCGVSLALMHSTHSVKQEGMWNLLLYVHAAPASPLSRAFCRHFQRNLTMTEQAPDTSADPPPQHSTMKEKLVALPKRTVTDSPTSDESKDGVSAPTQPAACHDDDRLHSDGKHAMLVTPRLADSHDGEYLVCLPTGGDANTEARQVSKASEVSLNAGSVDNVSQKQHGNQREGEAANTTGGDGAARTQELYLSDDDDDDEDSSADGFVNSLMNDDTQESPAGKPSANESPLTASLERKDSVLSIHKQVMITEANDESVWSAYHSSNREPEMSITMPMHVEPPEKPDAPQGWLFTEFSTPNDEDKPTDANTNENTLEQETREEERDMSSDDEESEDDRIVDKVPSPDNSQVSDSMEASYPMTEAPNESNSDRSSSKGESEDDRSVDSSMDESLGGKPNSPDEPRGNESEDDSRPDGTVDSSGEEEEEEDQENDDDDEDDDRKKQRSGDINDAISISSTENEGVDSDKQDDKASKKRSRAIESDVTEQTATSSGVLERDREPETGDRVYAKFPDNGEWYWGEILAVKKRKRASDYQFSILFDDGDVSHRVVRDDIRTVNEFRRDRFDGKVLSLQEMYMMRCDKCELCEKPDCGSCASCKRNQRLPPNDKEDKVEVCLQKMCGAIPESQKKQPAEGLPEPWTFVFHKNKPYNGGRSYVPGLFISHPKHENAYRSIEAVVNTSPNLARLNPNVETEFNGHVGVQNTQYRTAQSPGSRAQVLSRTRLKASKTTGARGKMGGDEGQSECGCENCMKDACGKCAVCKSSPSGTSQHCFQKMCFHLPPEEKARTAVGFPPGWKFYFAKNKSRGPYTHVPVPGLWILSDGGKIFRSVEAVVASVNRVDDEERVARIFYTHVGLPEYVPASGHSPGSRAHVSTTLSKSTEASGKLPASGRNCHKACGTCEAVVNTSPNLASATEFNGHVGVQNTQHRTAQSHGSRVQVSSRTLLKASKTTGAHGKRSGEVGQRKCGCENCTREACGNCAKCKSSPSGTSQHCFQKMCLTLPPEAKVETAVGFPDGWMFYFAEHRKGGGGYAFKPVPGLFLLRNLDGGERFRSVEAAVSKVKLDDGPEIARTFYTYVGLPELVPAGQAADSRVLLAPSVPSTTAAADEISGGNSTATCGTCANCTKDACGKCAMCTSNPRGDCFQKMCFKLSPEVAAKRAIGFPPGWKFYFAENKSGGPYLHDPVPGLYILSKGGKIFRSVKSAVRSVKRLGAEAEVASAFYSHVGLHDRIPTGDEGGYTIERPRKKQKTASQQATIDLVGRDLCFAWHDRNNQSKVVYGKVAGYEEDTETKDIRGKVVYRNRSREMVNCITGGDYASAVPESQLLPPAQVLGGCIRFAKEHRSAHSDAFLKDALRMHHWNWITPALRLEELRESHNGTHQLPSLKLDVRGFQLEFNVKPSTIPGAGYGVFLKCLPSAADGESDSDSDGEFEKFELRAGELVDLGVYAPFRVEDKKKEAVFFAKNYVHSHQCEVWSFKSGDSRYQFDITDDVTGEIHSEAMSHVPAYVNESNDEDAICIRAEHDAEGSVHYLLGHAFVSQDTFSLPADGTEVEVFVNYGDDYEVVRVRKGYSFLPEESDEKIKLLDDIAHEDAADLEEMVRFTDVDVEATIEYFLDFFTREDVPAFSNKVLYRMLAVSVVLECRAQKSLIDQYRAQNDFVDGDEGGDIFVDWRKVLRDVDDLVIHLLDTIEDEFMDKLKLLQVHGSYVELLVEVLRMLLPEKEVQDIANML